MNKCDFYVSRSRFVPSRISSSSSSSFSISFSCVRYTTNISRIIFCLPLILLNQNSNAVSHCVAAKEILCNNYHVFSSIKYSRSDSMQWRNTKNFVNIVKCVIIVYLTVMRRQNFHLVLFKMSRFEQSVFVLSRITWLIIKWFMIQNSAECA